MGIPIPKKNMKFKAPATARPAYTNSQTVTVNGYQINPSVSPSSNNAGVKTIAEISRNGRVILAACYIETGRNTRQAVAEATTIALGLPDAIQRNEAAIAEALLEPID